MGSFLEKLDCSDTEYACWECIDLLKGVVKYIPQGKKKEFIRKVKMLDKIFDEESDRVWKDYESM